jgi:hypothetical protein
MDDSDAAEAGVEYTNHINTRATIPSILKMIGRTLIFFRRDISDFSMSVFFLSIYYFLDSIL